MVGWVDGWREGWMNEKTYGEMQRCGLESFPTVQKQALVFLQHSLATALQWALYKALGHTIPFDPPNNPMK